MAALPWSSSSLARTSVAAMNVSDEDPAIFSELPHRGLCTFVSSTNRASTNAEPLMVNVLMVSVPCLLWTLYNTIAGNALSELYIVVGGGWSLVAF